MPLKSPTILFLPFHGMGHFNALFGIARALQQTHTVVFAGTGFFAQHVRNAGFTFHILYTFPFGLGLESWIHEIRKSKHPRLGNIIDRWKDTLYNERRKELSRILEEYQPQHVLVDVQQATDVVVLKSIDPHLRVTGVSVAPPYYLIPGVPPANSTALPGETEQIEWWHNKVRGTIRSKQWRQRLRYLGMDDQWVVRRRLRRNGMPHLKATYDSLFTLAIDGIDQLVLTYREFDFASAYLPHLRYVGAHPDTTVPESGTEVTGKLVNDINAQGRTVIYCSFGTVPPARNILTFLEHLSNALAVVNGYAIVSARLTTTDKNRLESEGNLSILEWVPQAFILKSAKVFVTHGGINSVHDGIRNEVPMLVYPVEPNYDQNGNAARVEYYGLGLRGELEHDSASDIQQKLSALLNDSRFRQALGEFKRKTSTYKLDDVLKAIV